MSTSTRFSGPLSQLMRIVRKRALHATATIDASDDPAIIDREMKYIRPFWEFYIARRKFNSEAFWDKRRRDVFLQVEGPVYEKTALVWIPARRAVIAAKPEQSTTKNRQLLYILLGLDNVVFNFIGLLSRMKYTLGIEDGESFRILTSEPGDQSYQIRYRCQNRFGEESQSYRILSCQFQQPRGEELKIERDYSEQSEDPEIMISLHQNLEPGQSMVRYQGKRSQLRSGNGSLKIC